MSDFIIIISYFFFWNIQHRRRKTRSILSVEKKSKNNENGNHTRRMLSGNDKERQIKPIEHASWNAINAIYVTFNGFWCLLKVKLWTIYTYLERAVGFVCECMRVACNATKRPRATKKHAESGKAINFVIHSHYRFHMIWTKANSDFSTKHIINNTYLLTNV